MLLPDLLYPFSHIHYNDDIMGTTASQITSFTIVYSTVYSGLRSKKTSKLRVTGLRAGNSPVTGEFPAQMASNAENVSILWRHHVLGIALLAFIKVVLWFPQGQGSYPEWCIQDLMVHKQTKHNQVWTVCIIRIILQIYCIRKFAPAKDILYRALTCDSIVWTSWKCI